MNKKFFITTLIMCFAMSLFSLEFDWGGTLKNFTNVTFTQDLPFTQGDSVSLWIELDMSEFFNVRVSGGYSFLYFNREISHIPDASELKFYGGNKTFDYKVGRFRFSDVNRNLASTIMDGAQFSYRNPFFEATAAAGFTGFVFNDNSSVFMTISDLNATSNNALLASPRILGYGEASFFVLPWDGSVRAAVLGQMDFREMIAPDGMVDSLDSIYALLGTKGRLGSMIYYNAYAIGSYGFYNNLTLNAEFTTITGAAGIEIDMPLNLPMSPFLSLDLFYSTGDDWNRGDFQGATANPNMGTLNQYVPFSSQNVGYVNSYGVGNLMYADFTGSFNPFEWLSVSVESLTLFRANNGPVSTLTVYSNSRSLFLGEEVKCSINVKPFSDLGLTVEGGVFIPNQALVVEEMKFKASGLVTLSF